MKTLHVIGMILTIFVLSAITFKASYAAKPAATCLRETLMENVHYPDAILKKSGTGNVMVTFTISDDGKIVVRNIRTDNEELASYVRKTLSNINCSNLFGNYNQHYRINFRFRLT